MSNIIDCNLHDYIEIACMYKYQVRLELKSGDFVVGVPRTTLVENSHEFLVFDGENVEYPESESESKFKLSQLSSMRVLTKNACFKDISFV